MLFTLILIRWIQLKRALQEGGLGSILLPFLILGLSIASLKAYQEFKFATLLSGGLLIFCTGLQLARKDKVFAQLHVPHWHQQMYLEYLILCLPFTITALFTTHYYFFIVVNLLLFAVPKLSYAPAQKTSFKKLSKLFSPAVSIEWIAGIRAQYLSLIPLYVIALATCWVRILPLILLFLCTGIIQSFYNEHEARHILKARHQKGKDFLIEKIKTHSLYIVFLYSPVLVINCIFHPNFIDIAILFLCAQLALVIFAITMKYSCYIPSQKNNTTNVTVSVVSIASVIPYFLPLPLLFALVYYKKATENLTHYFHDTH